MRAPTLLLVLTLAACLPRVGPALDGGMGGGSGGGGAATGGGGGGGGGGADGCGDGQRSGLESDVDCGGPCAPCTLNASCNGPLDCASGVCTANRCAVPARACAPAFAGCGSFVDLTDAGTREVLFPNGNQSYQPKCVRVRFGQAVTFSGGELGNHPLDQGCGPTSNLVRASSGSSATFTFDRALGVYGYYCTAHGSQGGGGMAGAIEVVR